MPRLSIPSLALYEPDALAREIGQSLYYGAADKSLPIILKFEKTL
jgi:hypothetical protein